MLYLDTSIKHKKGSSLRISVTPKIVEVIGMKVYTLARIIILGFCIFCLGTNADEKTVPIFKIVSSRSYLDPPSVEVVFPNGFKDEFVLEHYNPFKRSKGGHSYIGYLKNTPGSSVAVSGNLANPDDRMEITLLSQFVCQWWTK